MISPCLYMCNVSSLKHILLCCFTGGLYYLLVGKSHVVSRRDGDLTLADDQSISRRHAIITVEHSIKDLVRNFKAKMCYQNTSFPLPTVFILIRNGWWERLNPELLLMIYEWRIAFKPIQLQASACEVYKYLVILMDYNSELFLLICFLCFCLDIVSTSVWVNFCCLIESASCFVYLWPEYSSEGKRKR